ncbi:MAG: hypothetical protein EOP92_27510 [Lysobacteraceae bacterium]|nr:MAG: hypothetical protein EOP92_27510 [Xanthomonadaceae bacterium]
MPRQDIIPSLSGGLLDSEARSATGVLFPQPRVHGPAGPVLLDALAGSGWRIVTSLRREQLPPELPEMAGALGMLACVVPGEQDFSSGPHYLQTGELDGVLAAWFDHYRCRAALVRPDHYVYGVVDSGEALAAMLAGLLQRLK